MAKFRVLEIRTVVDEFEIEAKDRHEAIEIVNKTDGLKPQRSKVVEIEYETELLTISS